VSSGISGSRIALAALVAAATTLAAPASRAESGPPKLRSAILPSSPPDAERPFGLAPAPPIRGALSGEQPREPESPPAGRRLPRPYPPPPAASPPPFSPKRPLPALEAYPASSWARRAARLRATASPSPAAPPPPTVAATPTIKTKPRPKPDPNPYDPVGVGLGSTLLFPHVEAAGGYDDNPNRLSPNFNSRPSKLFRAEGGLKVKSDWARHSLEGELRGAYSEYFDFPTASRPEAAGFLVARYDVTRETALDLRGRLSLDTIRPGAPAIFSGIPAVQVVNRPVVLGLGAQPGVTQRFNRLELSLRGTYDRVWYENARYSDGSILDLARTSYNGFGGLGRLSFEVSPDLKPFVEGSMDRRVHDLPTDFNGFYRDSVGYVVRGGAAFNVTELVKGEVSGGYGERTYDDPRLPELRGPIIDAALIYTPSALTTLTLRGSTTLNETTLANAAGVLTRSVALQLSHDLLRNLNVTLTGNYFANDYQGADVVERGGGVGVRLDYRITRTVSLRGSYMHERLDSSFPNADYTANVYSLGLRFQL
jgi:hypothetical protein